jgi:hypothetical protein
MNQCISVITLYFIQARGKSTDASNQKGPQGPKTPTMATKNNHQGKNGQKPPQKPPSAQKGQVKAPQQKIPPTKNGKKLKKGQRHQTYDLIVTIDLVSDKVSNSFSSFFFSIANFLDYN